MFSKLFILLVICNSVAGHKIAFIHVMASTSHVIPSAALAQELTLRGHEVTFIVGKKFSVISPNIRQLVVPGVPDVIARTANSQNKTVLQNVYAIRTATNELCDVVSSSNFLADHLQNVKYDIMFFTTLFQECVAVTATHYQKDVPFIMIHPTMFISAMTSPITGVNNWDASYLPNAIFPMTEQMNFWQRFSNFLGKMSSSVMPTFMLSSVNDILTRNLGPNHKDVYAINKEASLLFLNSNFEIDYPAPVTPDVVMTGCMQCREAQPLPTVLRNFVGRYKKEGIIVFSLGSVLTSSVLDEEVVQNFIEAFKELPQGVIWHSDANMKNLPKNILVQRWLPMQDVLGDPSTRVIISHGGYTTLQESIYHGVCYLGLPTLGTKSDRSRNVKLAEYRGIGLFFHEDANKTKALILDKLNQVLHNPKFKEKVLHYSGLLKKQIVSPKDLAVYKTEHVIRYKGAKHFKSHARNLSVVEYYMLDVLLTILLSVIIALFIFYFIVKLIFKFLRFLCCSQKKIKTQ